MNDNTYYRNPRLSQLIATCRQTNCRARLLPLIPPPRTNGDRLKKHPVLAPSKASVSYDPKDLLPALDAADCGGTKNKNKLLYSYQYMNRDRPRDGLWHALSNSGNIQCWVGHPTLNGALSKPFAVWHTQQLHAAQRPHRCRHTQDPCKLMAHVQPGAAGTVM
jgi:hypothetical protein